MEKREKERDKERKREKKKERERKRENKNLHDIIEFYQCSTIIKYFGFALRTLLVTPPIRIKEFNWLESLNPPIPHWSKQ